MEKIDPRSNNIRHLGSLTAEVGLDDFQGNPNVCQEILNAPKWGQDDDSVDALALRWLSIRDEVIREVELEVGGKRNLTAHVVRSLHHVEGKKLGATPDGRRSGSPLADGVGAQLGTATKGATAMLNSVRKLQPSKHWTGGYNLNLALSIGAGAQDDLDKVLAMLEAFFSNGGQEIQINFLDLEELKDAEIHPERHSDLIVRIAGFNARFIDLSPVEKAEIIARAEFLGTVAS